MGTGKYLPKNGARERNPRGAKPVTTGYRAEAGRILSRSRSNTEPKPVEYRTTWGGSPVGSTQIESVDEAERLLDPTQFRAGRLLADDVPVVARDESRPDERRAVVDRPEVRADVECRLDLL